MCSSDNSHQIVARVREGQSGWKLARGSEAAQILPHSDSCRKKSEKDTGRHQNTSLLLEASLAV
jgi:hypothetical protein